MVDFKDSKPFYRKHLEQDERSRVITLRVNPDEEALIKQARVLLDVEADGKAIKICFTVGLNVLQNTFGDKLLKYISSTKRERKSDYEKPQKASSSDFVIPKTPDL
jgi:hypothetical protein